MDVLEGEEDLGGDAAARLLSFHSHAFPNVRAAPVCRHACTAPPPARRRPPRPVTRLILITQGAVPPSDENEAGSCLRSIRSRGRGSYTRRQPHAYLYPARPPAVPPTLLHSLPRPHMPNFRTVNLQLCTLLLLALVSLAVSSSTGEVLEGDGEGCGRAVQLRNDADEGARTAVVSGRGVLRVWLRARSSHPQLSGGGRRLAAGPAAQARARRVNARPGPASWNWALACHFYHPSENTLESDMVHQSEGVCGKERNTGSVVRLRSGEERGRSAGREMEPEVRQRRKQDELARESAREDSGQGTGVAGHGGRER